MTDDRAVAALDASGIQYTLRHPGRSTSLQHAAELLGIEPRQLIKTLVVRRGDDDFLFVLVPGDRSISWPKLRALLGVQRMSMPDASVAKDATGYERGAITPFGSTTAWPVIADERLVGGIIFLGTGKHGRSAEMDGAEAVRVLDAQIADVTEGGEGPLKVSAKQPAR